MHNPISRRSLMLRLSSLCGLATNTFNGDASAQTNEAYSPVVPLNAESKLRFPSDHGAHEKFRIEWWYVTGWLNNSMGFQVTFFRSKTSYKDSLSADKNNSRFAPNQLLLADAALSITEHQSLLHDGMAARTFPALASYSSNDCDLHINQGARRWSMQRLDNSPTTMGSQYEIKVQSTDFALELNLLSPHEPWLQGNEGYSRKGPEPLQASYYYSRPQLITQGKVRYKNKWIPASGTSWLDHEWSSELLDPTAVGWDWLGLNLNDGSALTLFRVRDKTGSPIHSYAAQRFQNGNILFYKPKFEAKGQPWKSPRTGAQYPIWWTIQLAPNQASAAQAMTLEIEPHMPDQELDGRRSTGTVYWEGAVRVMQIIGAGKEQIGKGYLELTGYYAPVRL